MMPRSCRFGRFDITLARDFVFTASCAHAWLHPAGNNSRSKTTCRIPGKIAGIKLLGVGPDDNLVYSQSRVAICSCHCLKRSQTMLRSLEQCALFTVHHLFLEIDNSLVASVLFHWEEIKAGFLLWLCLQCFDAVGWAAGRASGL